MVSGGFLKDATRVSGKCLQGIKKASGGGKKGCLEVTKRVSKFGSGRDR